MVRIVPLLRSDSLSICRFDHPREHDDRFVERVADVYAVSFVESGEYLLEIDEGRWRLKAGDVRIFHPGMRYRATSVKERFNDVGLTLNYLSAEADEFDPDLTWARSQQPVLRATNRLRYFVSGIGYPDLMIVGADALHDGPAAIRAWGYFSPEWKLEGGDVAWRDEP